MIKILFWLVVCVDVAAILLLFVLGLAAAVSSRTSPILVAAYMLVIPGLLLAGAILLFLRSHSMAGRSAALVLAASPMLVLFLMRGIEEAKLNLNTDASGNLTYFHAGPQRDISLAVLQNDAPAVTALLPRVNLNERGYRDVTLLTLALRQLRTKPDHLEVLRVLVKAGADPNLGADELPLEMALQTSGKTGPEPVLLLLDAGAKPNAKNQFGSPVYFAATGSTAPPELLQAMFDHGADVHLNGPQGSSVVHQAALAMNWQAVLILLKRGADWKQIRTPDGLTFLDMAESNQRVYGDKPGLAEVLVFLKAAQ